MNVTEIDLDSRWFFLLLLLAGAFALGFFSAGLYAKHYYRRFGQQLGLCLDVPCDHYNARMPAIESVIAQRAEDSHYYLFVGDSNVERADLPVICGRVPINAGISWATVNTFQHHAKRLADLAKPDFILISLGGNDALRNHFDNFRERLSKLVASLSEWPVILVPIPQTPTATNAAKFNSEIARIPVPQARPLEDAVASDGLHLSAEAYGEWKKSIIDAATNCIGVEPRSASGTFETCRLR
jgi:lysophospholipase L1-like esterase